MTRRTYFGLPVPHLRFYRGRWRCYVPASRRAPVPPVYASGYTPERAYRNWVWLQGFIPV